MLQVESPPSASRRTERGPAVQGLGGPAFWFGGSCRGFDVFFLKRKLTTGLVHIQIKIQRYRHCLDPKSFLDFDTVAFSFLFDKY